MKIKFLETRIVDDYRKGTEDEERYDKDETADLPPRSAMRWVNRGVAVILNDETKKVLPASPTKAKAGK